MLGFCSPWVSDENDLFPNTVLIFWTLQVRIGTQEAFPELCIVLQHTAKRGAGDLFPCLEMSYKYIHHIMQISCQTVGYLHQEWLWCQNRNQGVFTPILQISDFKSSIKSGKNHGF